MVRKFGIIEAGWRRATIDKVGNSEGHKKGGDWRVSIQESQVKSSDTLS
jgi:hypothetical protein